MDKWGQLQPHQYNFNVGYDFFVVLIQVALFHRTVNDCFPFPLPGWLYFLKHHNLNRITNCVVGMLNSDSLEAQDLDVSIVNDAETVWLRRITGR